MMFKTHLLLCALSVVQGFTTNPSVSKCTTRCFKAANTTDYYYCKAVCVFEKPEVSNHGIDTNRFDETKALSGYAAVAAKKRFYQQQLENQNKHKRTTWETRNFAFFVIFVGLLIAGLVAASMGTTSTLNDGNHFKSIMSVKY